MQSQRGLLLELSFWLIFDSYPRWKGERGRHASQIPSLHAVSSQAGIEKTFADIIPFHLLPATTYLVKALRRPSPVSRSPHGAGDDPWDRSAGAFQERLRPAQPEQGTSYAPLNEPA